MHRIGIVTGIVVVMLIGIGIAGAQTPTPTPEPTPTPTPVEKACEQFDLAVQDAWWGTITQIPDEDANTKYHNDLTDRLIARLSWTMALKAEEPAMERMVSPLYWTLRSDVQNLTFALRSPFDRMVIGVRQMERMCFAQGYEKQFNVLPDVLAEYACVNPYSVNKQMPRRFERLVWRCEKSYADINHRHDWDYADKNHTHGGW